MLRVGVIQHDITNHATMHHPHYHRRTRNVQSTFYWGAVYTLLFGSVVAMVSILLYVLYLCPACCYRTNSGCTNEEDDENSNQNGDHIVVDTKKVPHHVAEQSNGYWCWWYWWSSWNDMVRFLSSSRSTDATTSSTDDSVTASVVEINIGPEQSCRSDTDDATIDLSITTTTATTYCMNHTGCTTLKDVVVDPNQQDAPELIVEEEDYDEEADHTIMVDVYRHYVYKNEGNDDDDNDLMNYDLYRH